MTTLADMTPEQRYDCVGMWCEVTEEFSYPAVLVEISHFHGRSLGTLLTEGLSGKMLLDPYPIDSITPRPDLPRAWQPDGTPVNGKWETAIEYSNHQPPTRMSRFVGEWEEE